MSPVPRTIQYSFGPGGITPAVKAIIIANVGLFLLTLMAPETMVETLGLRPSVVIEQVELWRLVTYLFLHSPVHWSHILFNMLAVWMFGVDLERRWGTRAFVKYYLVCGVGAGLSTLLVALLPFDGARVSYVSVTIGASGAVYGLLMAWGLLFPHREILFMLIFPLKARVFVILMGAIAFLSAVSASGGPVAHVAHLGGLVFGYLYLKGPGSFRRGPRNLRLNLQYYLTRWRMERMRKKFNVHQGGKDKWVH
jgi:membrane associated rhomboid family serine protease